MLPKSPSASLRYGRKITKLLYLTVAVMLLVSLLIGFFAAYAKIGGMKETDVGKKRSQMRKAILRKKQEQPKESLGMNQAEAASNATPIVDSLQIVHGDGKELSVQEVIAKAEKPDLFEVLRLAQAYIPSAAPTQVSNSQAEPSVAPLQFEDLNFALIIDGESSDASVEYIRGFVGVRSLSIVTVWF